MKGKKSMKKTVNISLDEILQRKLEYYSNDSNQELLALNSGYVRGFKQMIADINLSEATFTDKYINILQGLKKEIEPYEGTETDETVDELCGYNNAIVDILSLLDLKYFYDI